TCRVDRAEGGTRRPDVTLEADAEELVAAAQARAAPWVGRLARTVDWVRGPGRAEDVAAAITGTASLAWALARRRIRVSGDRALASRLNRAFWHFWQRTAMTRSYIAIGCTLFPSVTLSLALRHRLRCARSIPRSRR